jgi:hypothetical protein
MCPRLLELSLSSKSSVGIEASSSVGKHVDMRLIGERKEFRMS